MSNKLSLKIMISIMLIIFFVSVSVQAVTLQPKVIKKTAQPLKVVVSIAPLAGLVAPLLSTNDEVKVILQGGESPHGFQLKPSDFESLQQADVVVSVGTPVDQWLHAALERLDIKPLSMNQLPHIERLENRSGGFWEAHGHEHKTHSLNNPLSSLRDADNSHQQPLYGQAGSDKAHSPLHINGHLWMSYRNAIHLVDAFTKTLQVLKPTQTELIQQRHKKWLKILAQADKRVTKTLQPVQEVPFLVLHDAFYYFEHRYGLNGVGSLQLNPNIAPSLKRVAQLRAKIEQGKVQCVFKEPQFPAKKIAALTRGLDVSIGQLDPMGVFVHPALLQQKRQFVSQGFIRYDQFMLNLAAQFKACLGPSG